MKDHLRNVASLPCAQCGIHGYSQAAHSNRYQDGKGARLKANDMATFPLCCTRMGEVGCHVRHDQCIGMTRAEADARTDRYLASTEHILRNRGLWPTALPEKRLKKSKSRKLVATNSSFLSMQLKRAVE